MAIRQIRLYGDTVLTTVCRPVTEVNAHVRLLLGDMTDTLEATPKSSALAANQLGVLRRLVVLRTDAGIKKLVNPVITSQSGEQDCFETCACFKDISGTTIRPQKITVEALGETGETITLTLENDPARSLCHALDHLDGVLFITKIVRFENKPLE